MPAALRAGPAFRHFATSRIYALAGWRRMKNLPLPKDGYQAARSMRDRNPALPL